MTVHQIARTASKYPWDIDIPKPDGSVDNVERPQPSVGNSEPESSPDTSATVETTQADGPESMILPLDTVSFWWDDQRRFHLVGDLDEASGSIIENALTEARDGLFQNGQVDVDWADSLLEVAERPIDAVESPARRSRFRTHIHRHQDGTTTNATGCGITDAVAEYITCDSIRSDVIEVDGIPISVGRSQHTVLHEPGARSSTATAVAESPAATTSAGSTFITSFTGPMPAPRIPTI